MSGIRLPAMRDEVVAALRALADRRHQDSRWGVYDPDVNYYDDLSLNVHVLYDDTQVLPDPEAVVGAVIFSREVPWLRRLHACLGPMIDDLGDRPDADYLADPRWQLVVKSAREALEAMEAGEQ